MNGLTAFFFVKTETLEKVSGSEAYFQIKPGRNQYTALI